MGEGVGGDQESDYDLRKATSKAASKLNNLDSKYDLLKKAKYVLDLCPGSGGWMHVAVLKIQQGGLVVGVGLHPIKPIPDAILIQEDITAPECRDTIRTHMTENGFTGFDLVMRGGGLSSAPWDKAYQLTESIKLATEFLSPEGAFVAKMFDGAQDYSPMLYCLQQLFGSVVVTKPTFTFPETYIVAKSYKAPEKINPRLLVARNLFSIKEDINPEVRYSSGRASTSYTKEESIAKRVVSASDFVWSETPLEVFGIADSLSFNDDACLSLKGHSLTTRRVKMMCKDLRVLDKQHLKHLMKWRLRVREAMSHAQKATPEATDEIKGSGDNEMPDEMEKLTYILYDKSGGKYYIADKSGHCC
ncbi:hypothetical protein MKX03_032350 [Papaver bracteatum]|nr:hypothetical protein MKX03_032350 [Papaver bracteatum]